MSDAEISIRQVTVAGGGQSGSQIAAQCAAFGAHVRLYDIDPVSLQAARELTSRTLADMETAGVINCEKRSHAASRIEFTTNPEQAAEGRQLLIETVTEDLKIKRDVLRQFNLLCPPEALFTTNTSFLSPSSLAHASGRPSLFAGFHFHTPVWGANVVDVMPHRLTAPDTIEKLLKFGREIGQNAVRLNKESNGYLYNRMSLPMLLQSLQMAAEDVASVEDIDRAWMGVTKMPMGPLGMLDNIGLDTVHKIATYWAAMLGDKSMVAGASFLAEKIANGELGVKSGKGFYTYPQPSFSRPGFVLHVGGMHQPAAPELKRFIIEPPAPGSTDMHLANNGSQRSQCTVVGSGMAAKSLVEQLRAANNTVLHWRGSSGDKQEEATQGATEPGAGQLYFVADAGERNKDISSLCEDIISLYELGSPWLRDLATNSQSDPPQFTALTIRANLVTESAAIASGAASAFANSLQNAGGLDIATPTIRILEAATADPTQQATNPAAVCQQISAGRMYVKQESSRTRVQPLSGTWLIHTGGGTVEMEIANYLAMHQDVHVHIVAPWKLPDADYSVATSEMLQNCKRTVMKQAYQAGRKPNVAWQEFRQRILCQQYLMKMWKTGREVEFHSCNVSDAKAAGSLLDAVSSDQTLEGIVWGTGVLPETKLKHIKAREVRPELRKYVVSMLQVLRLLAENPPRHLLSIGHISGRHEEVHSSVARLMDELTSRLTRWFAIQHPACVSRHIRLPGALSSDGVMTEAQGMPRRTHIGEVLAEELSDHEAFAEVEWRFTRSGAD